MRFFPIFPITLLITAVFPAYAHHAEEADIDRSEYLWLSAALLAALALVLMRIRAKIRARKKKPRGR